MGRDLIFENSYKSLLKKIINFGELQDNRTNVKSMVLSNLDITYYCYSDKNYPPILTGKKIFYEKALTEFKWMWNGRSDIKYLKNNGVHWWDQFADENGIVQKSYGYQIRNFNGSGFDQIEYCKNEIKSRSRRAVITFWNPLDLKDQDIPCCYTTMTFVEVGGDLDMKMDFRSSDAFLGLPYDFLVGYFFLKKMCEETCLKMGKIKYSIANAHIYNNHRDQVKEYLSLPIYYPPEEVNWVLQDYKHGPLIRAKLNN